MLLVLDKSVVTSATHGEPDARKLARPVRREACRDLPPQGGKALHAYSTRQGFKLYWRWKSRKKPGRPRVDREIRNLIRRMSRENPTWGAPRILSELLLLGHSVAESTIAKHMIIRPKPPSQTWRTLLANHAGQIAAIDFFTVTTVTFRVLYVFVILRHERRRVVHFNVTTNPTARWAAQQIVEAFRSRMLRVSCFGIVTASTVGSSVTG